MNDTSIDPDAPLAMRMMLIRRYGYLTLKFSHPIFSESGRWEASWQGGNAVEDTEPELMLSVLEALEDCGDEAHLWETVDEKRDPRNDDNLILTQRRRCVYCDPKERVLLIHHPDSSVIQRAKSPR